MIIRIEDIKDLCSKILSAVDSSEVSQLTETLQLKTDGTVLHLSVTNREYFADVKFDMKEEIEFNATVNAMLFLKLISQTTSETVELNVNDTALVVRGNGLYKLPLIYDGNKLLELPPIDINNVTNEFDIKGDVLNSILLYNTKELTRGMAVRPAQKMYYVDEKGAITFTSGACVNNFTLPQNVKLLLTPKLVKLFKLFKGGDVHFRLGYDAISDDIIQTKVSFEDDSVSITTILSCDDTLLNSVPVSAIRGRAMNTYPHSVTLNKDAVLQTINRLLLFHTDKVSKPFSTVEFSKEYLTLYGEGKGNKEEIFYTGTSNIENVYSAVLDMNDLKSVLETCDEQYITVSFGDSQAFVISRGNVYNVIPEVKQVS